MHYYQFNVADYRKDTTHLSPIEHYIYRQLIDWYFLDEKPIISNKKTMLRRLGLEPEFSYQLNAVLEDFFILEDDGFHQKRIDAELLDYKSYLNKQTENGKKGGRPPKIKTQINPPLFLANPNLTQKKPNQELLTTNHKLLTKDQDILATSEKPDDDDPPVKNKTPIKEIVKLYHKILPTLPRVEKLTKAREGYLKQRWREDLQDLTQWENFFHFVSESDFLMGRIESYDNRPPFLANLEWITKPSNFAKIAEDKYHG